MSNYTEEDAKEVMDILYKKIKEQGGRRQPLIVTQKEYDKYEDAGCDMSEYMTIETMYKIARAEELKKIKEKRDLLLAQKHWSGK